MPKQEILDAERELAKRDPMMRKLIRAVGHADLGSRRQSDHFNALVRAIVFQQLAGKAANAIHTRFVGLFDEAKIDPEAVLAAGHARLRTVGLSEAKTLSILDLATKVADGSVPLRGIGRYEDDAIVERLTSVRGIGPWTAEMFLIFQLGRLDVWPVDDYGVRRGWSILHRKRQMITPRALEAEGDKFRPYRSVAAWYCWRAVEEIAAPT